jgi:acyl carrier protein
MTQEDVFAKVVEILTPYVKNKAALATINPGTSILKDLEVNSARLVDIVLGMEDAFNVEVADEEADGVITVGDAVKLILNKAA